MGAVVCFVFAYSSQYTKEIMVYGWPPVIASMILSNLSGPISESSIKKFPTFARFQVVMNGAGGNLGAIFCSKLSTDLMVTKSEYTGKTVDHRASLPGPYRGIIRSFSTMGHTRTSRTSVMPSEDLDPHFRIQTSWVEMREEQNYLMHFMSMRALLGEGDMSRFCRMLLLLIVPGQAVFACIVVGAASGWSELPSPLFLCCFITASAAQVIVLLMASRQLVVMFWRSKIDPDNGASPLICGLGDLTGTSFMALAYWVVSKYGGDAWPGHL